ncbi:MAG: hypothetical protein D6729_17040 [Deltaproteobacteria bacterium]|nr:MAG: hypothetical protein D6729_17040 [Deltaproteobacteria bacterium]
MRYIMTTTDKREALCMLRALDTADALAELAEELRMMVKHGSQFDTTHDALEWCRQAVYEIATDAGAWA